MSEPEQWIILNVTIIFQTLLNITTDWATSASCPLTDPLQLQIRQTGLEDFLRVIRIHQYNTIVYIIKEINLNKTTSAK